MVNSTNWPLPVDASPLQRAPVREKDDDVEGYVRDMRDEAGYPESIKSAGTLVVGTTELFKDGKICLIPMPSADPKDPLNLPQWRKWVAIGVICFFGALALSAEIIIGALLPIFLLEYAGLDPRIISDVDFQALSGGNGATLNPLAVIPKGVAPPDLGKIAMLATIPLLTNGVASYLLVPLSIGIGRRPVLLFSAAAAWGGGLWAGLSNSLITHMAARAIQGLGAGAVEALIPLIIQDIVFIHQRNKAMSAIVSSQSLIIVGIGIASPFIAANYTWRWLYFITSGLGFLAWVLLIFFLPETRWSRSQEELSGRSAEPLGVNQDRPDLDTTNYTPRTLRTNIALFPFGFQFRNAGRSMIDTLRCTFFPAVIWSTLTNSIFIIVNQAAAQLTSFILLAQGWEFQYTGLSVLPFVAATALVFALGGPVADRVSLYVTKHNGGAREAEHHLPNLVLPFVAGIAGTFIFGFAGQNNLHWAVPLFGWFLIIFAFLTSLTVINVYIVESYPQWAGPVLVNVSSLRLIISFFLASEATQWVLERGLFQTFALYAEVMIVVALGIPMLFFTGKRIRMWTSGNVRSDRTKVKFVDDTASEDSSTRGAR